MPIKYSVGNIDQRFNVTSADLKLELNDAAQRWNTSLGVSAFEYSDNAPLKINMVYDDRQANLDATNARLNGLNDSKNTPENRNNALQSTMDKYESDLANYNNQVSYWNSKGGAPKPEFQQLESLRVSLDNRRSEILQIVNELNLDATSLNSNIGKFNNQLDANKNKIITKGLYYSGSDKIDIFTYGGKNELRLVLLHEMGHAFGVGHDSGQNSIMNAILNDSSVDNPTLTAEDINMVIKRCRIKK